jgi:hypothetical protein
MRHLLTYTREFEIVTEDGDSDLVYTDGYMPDGEAPCPAEVVPCEPDADDIEDGLTAVDIAVRWFENEGPAAWEPDTVPGAAHWFSAREEAVSGEEVSAHLEGFSDEERAEITRRASTASPAPSTVRVAVDGQGRHPLSPRP